MSKWHRRCAARPPIYYWYVDFYRAISRSQAHTTLCKRLFGVNLGQDGFAEIGHLATMLELLQLCPADRALDLGCGNGGIAGYLTDASGARVVGMDYIPERAFGNPDPPCYHQNACSHVTKQRRTIA